MTTDAKEKARQWLERYRATNGNVYGTPTTETIQPGPRGATGGFSEAAQWRERYRTKNERERAILEEQRLSPDAPRGIPVGGILGFLGKGLSKVIPREPELPATPTEPLSSVLNPLDRGGRVRALQQRGLTAPQIFRTGERLAGLGLGILGKTITNPTGLFRRNRLQRQLEGDFFARKGRAPNVQEKIDIAQAAQDLPDKTFGALEIGANVGLAAPALASAGRKIPSIVRALTSRGAAPTAEALPSTSTAIQRVLPEAIPQPRTPTSDVQFMDFLPSDTRTRFLDTIGVREPTTALEPRSTVIRRERGVLPPPSVGPIEQPAGARPMPGSTESRLAVRGQQEPLTDGVRVLVNEEGKIHDLVISEQRLTPELTQQIDASPNIQRIGTDLSEEQYQAVVERFRQRGAVRGGAGDLGPELPSARRPTRAQQPSVEAVDVPVSVPPVAPTARVAGGRTPPPDVPQEAAPLGPATARVMERISFSEPKPRVTERLRSGLNGLMSGVFDDLYPVKRFTDAAKKATDVSDPENPYILARLLRGVSGKSNTFIDQGTFGKQFWKSEQGRAVPDFTGPGLREVLQPVREGRNWQDFSAYLTSRRAVELNGRNIKTGVDNADALQAITELEASNPGFSQIAERVYKYQDDVLEYGRQSGLFSSETAAKLREYKNYAPFHRVMDGMETRGMMGRALANIASPIKRIKGSDRLIVNPLESIVKNTHVIVDAADRNQVGVMMARLANDIPELQSVFKPIKTPVSRQATVTAKDLGISIDGLSPDDAERLVDIFRPQTFAKNANEVTVLIDGKKKFFKVDPDLYKGMLALEKQDLGMFGRFFGAPARWLRAGAILAPDFMVKNPTRDQLQAFVYSRYGFLPGVDWMKGIGQMLGKSDDYNLYRMSGGEMANLVSVDRTTSGRTVDEIAKARGFRNYIRNPIELLRIVSEAAEKGTRVGEFSRGVRQGADPISAAFSSREVVQDFSKAGTVTRALNQIIPFLSANVGGYSRLATAFKERPMQTSMKAFMGITLPSLLLYSVNRNDPRYVDAEQWQKDLFWFIPTPNVMLRLPKPFMLGQAFGSVPERFFEYLDKRDPELFKESIRNAVQQGMPGFLPQAILPFVENMTNHSAFLDRPIVPRGREDAPAQMQYSGGTSEAAKALGRWVNYSPAKIDNLFRGYTATLGRYATDIIDPILKRTGITPNIPDPDPSLADWPVIRSFVVRDPYGSSSASVNRFYRKLTEAEGWEKMFKEHLALGDQKAANKFRDKNPQAGLFYDYSRSTHYSSTARALRRVARQMSDIRTKQREVYNSRTMDGAEKRAKIDQLNKAMTRHAQKALADLQKVLP